MKKAIWELAYQSLTAEQVEIEFQNLVNLTEGYVRDEDLDRAAETLAELEFNVAYKRSESKMHVLYIMQNSYYKASEKAGWL